MWIPGHCGVVMTSDTGRRWRTICDISILRDTAAFHLKHAQPYCSNGENPTAMMLNSSFRKVRIIDKVIARCGTEIRTIERLHRPTGYDSLMLLLCLWKREPFLTSALNGGA